MSESAAAETSTATVREVAREIRIHANTVYAAVKRGDIPSIRVGRRVLVPRSWLKRVRDGEIE
jgi:excisionase family DNA binding protein